MGPKGTTTISIDAKAVTEFRRLRYNWVDIAKALNVNIRTLQRWISATALLRLYTEYLMMLRSYGIV